MAPDPSARANGTERGCVEDQPQRVGSSKASGACSVLRLVEDDTAVLRTRRRSTLTPGSEVYTSSNAFEASPNFGRRTSILSIIER